ncbi:MAG: DUF45 domain-containing protein [Deltaproteobacteria bacterium]|nr:DUF45 domain-containing protein [Deltaproteobacteria bacterium]
MISPEKAQAEYTEFNRTQKIEIAIEQPLKEHNILQTIARVNRIFAGKEFGHIIDYRGILGNLNEAMNTYDALGGFDADDVDLTTVRQGHEKEIPETLRYSIEAPAYYGVVGEVLSEYRTQENERRDLAAEIALTIEKLLSDWYRQHAQRIFRERLEICLQRVAREGVKAPNLRIQKMTNRWGSCSEQGKIILNLELIKAPKECIDYVITHELCHLKEKHHGLRFWRLLEKLMPDYRERRQRLNHYADV